MCDWPNRTRPDRAKPLQFKAPERSRLQALQAPLAVTRAARERPAVVQSITTVAPELDPVRHQPIAAPELRTRHARSVGEAKLHLGVTRFERSAIHDRRALSR